MSQQIMDQVESQYCKSKLPNFRVGDTVDVHQKIVEGNRTRTQIFNGVVIARKGGGVSETFTVRRIVNNEGVERIFMLHSPRIAKLEVKREGKTRRAKLYYLRDRVGKSRRLKELRRGRSQKSGRPEAAATSEPVKAAETTPETAGV